MKKWSIENVIELVHEQDFNNDDLKKMIKEVKPLPDKMLSVHDTFGDSDTEFSNLEYIEQLIDCGQWSVLKDFLKKVDNIGLINLLRAKSGERGGSQIADEIFRRLEK